jgi:hypothetical protein
VVNSFIALGTGADDFGLKRDDPRIELGDRIGIEVKLDQKSERVAGARRRRDVVGIHTPMVKDVAGGVNGLSGQSLKL